MAHLISPQCHVIIQDESMSGRSSSLQLGALATLSLTRSNKSATTERTDASTASASSNDSPAETSSDSDSSPESATPPQSPETATVIPLSPREVAAPSARRRYSSPHRPVDSPRRSALRSQSPPVICPLDSPRAQLSSGLHSRLSKTVRFAPQLTRVASEPPGSVTPRNLGEERSTKEGFVGVKALSPRSCAFISSDAAATPRHASLHDAEMARRRARHSIGDLSMRFAQPAIVSMEAFISSAASPSNPTEKPSDLAETRHLFSDASSLTSPTKMGVEEALRQAELAGKRWLARQRSLDSLVKQTTMVTTEAASSNDAAPPQPPEPISKDLDESRSLLGNGVRPASSARMGVTEALQQAELARSRVTHLLARRQKPPVASSMPPSPRPAYPSPMFTPMVSPRVPSPRYACRSPRATPMVSPRAPSPRSAYSPLVSPRIPLSRAAYSLPILLPSVASAAPSPRWVQISPRASSPVSGDEECHRVRGKILTGGNPLLWQKAVDAMHAAAGTVRAAADSARGHAATATTAVSSPRCRSGSISARRAASSSDERQIGATTVSNADKDDGSRALEMAAAAAAASVRFSSRRPSMTSLNSDAVSSNACNSARSNGGVVMFNATATVSNADECSHTSDLTWAVAEATSTNAGSRSLKSGDLAGHGDMVRSPASNLQAATAKAMETLETWRALELVTTKTAVSVGVRPPSNGCSGATDTAEAICESWQTSNRERRSCPPCDRSLDSSLKLVADQLRSASRSPRPPAAPACVAPMYREIGVEGDRPLTAKKSWHMGLLGEALPDAAVVAL